MHISEVEKARLDKDHQMRYGYQMRNNSVYPHNDEVDEGAQIYRDTENKHARASDYEYNMERG